MDDAMLVIMQPLTLSATWRSCRGLAGFGWVQIHCSTFEVHGQHERLPACGRMVLHQICCPQPLGRVAAQHQDGRAGPGDHGRVSSRSECVDEGGRVGHRTGAIALVKLVFGSRVQEFRALDERGDQQRRP